MVSFPTPQNYAYNTFGGIRLRNGIDGNGIMTAEVCQNIDFVPQGLSSNMKIVTSLGNTLQGTLSGYEIIKGFETEQEGIKHCIVYAVNSTEGKIAEFSQGTFTTLVSGLEPNKKANGITLKNGAYDVFAFTNGEDFYKIQFYPSQSITRLYPAYDSQPVTGLALAEQSGSLVIGSDKGYVIASRKGDITDWDYVTPTDSNKAWYQLFGKPVTAVVPFIQGLLVFTADDSTILLGNFSTASGSRSNASLGGCMSFESWILHDKYLFFYDNNQKNIYYFLQNDYGQTKLGEPVAVDIQQFFDGVNKLQFASYVGNNRNELWVLTNRNKLIFDYYTKEWTERVCQDLTSYFVFDNGIYSTTADGKLLKEKDGDQCIYDGVFYPSVYTTQTIKLGSFSNLKEMELPPIVTVTSNNTGNFWCDVIVDDKKTKSKLLKARKVGYAQFWDTVSELQVYNLWGDPDNNINNAQFAPDMSRKTQQLRGKLIPNFYTLKFTFRTDDETQIFAIAALELKGITQETDTWGHK